MGQLFGGVLEFCDLRKVVVSGWEGVEWGELASDCLSGAGLETNQANYRKVPSGTLDCIQNCSYIVSGCFKASGANPWRVQKVSRISNLVTCFVISSENSGFSSNFIFTQVHNQGWGSAPLTRVAPHPPTVSRPDWRGFKGGGIPVHHNPAESSQKIPTRKR